MGRGIGWLGRRGWRGIGWTRWRWGRRIPAVAITITVLRRKKSSGPGLGDISAPKDDHVGVGLVNPVEDGEVVGAIGQGEAHKAGHCSNL